MAVFEATSDGYTCTRWPPRPVFSIYSLAGDLVHRSRLSTFDLTDSWALATRYAPVIRFGIFSNSSRRLRWSDDELRKQEENILYDLSYDALTAKIIRIKGLGIFWREEALWELEISNL